MEDITLGIILAIIGTFFIFKKLIDEVITPFIQRKMHIETNSKKITEIPKIAERIDEQDLKLEAHEKKLEDLERLQKKQFDILDDLQNKSSVADKLIISAMIAILDNQITGNSIDSLKNIKVELMKYLTVN